jgi:tryptophan synthase alpha chain
MSRISELFNKKKQDILNLYFTAGFPALNCTLPVMKQLQESGVDMIELGIPYSDPLADGPVIQSSGSAALANGMTIRTLLNQLENFRSEVHIPVLLMGYMNPVIQYGFENFCRDVAKAGVDGLILPDLPMYEFDKEFGAIIKKYGLDFIFLVTPETEEMRIRQLDSRSSGFLYAVSSSSTTGKSTSLEERENYFRKLQSMNLKNPVLIGFGIKDKSGFEKACSFANGAIIGTAFIKILEDAPPQQLSRRIDDFILSFK